MERIVGVTACVAAIKSTTVVPVEWQIQAQALGQIGVGDEMASKRYDVRVARSMIASAVSFVKPPAAISVPVNLGRRWRAATGS